MRIPLIVVLTGAAFAQSTPQVVPSHTNENLRGVSTVSRKIAWASGTHGVYLRMTDGETWVPGQVPDATNLDFRGVVAFSEDAAFLISSGAGELSRIYHTADGGQHWQLQFRNTNPKGFFDSMAFWDRSHGIVLGDPIADESGKLKFELLLTEDGESWQAIKSANLPPAMEGEEAFAASNSCMAIQGDHIWFATGGKVARVFHSADRGQSWQVSETPLLHGPDTEGIFSIAFRDRNHGVIAGGDYKQPEQDGPNLAFTSNGGQSWTISKIHPQAYFSAAAYDRRAAKRSTERVFLVDPKFVFDFRPPANPQRISPRKGDKTRFNAVSAFPEGGALVVGPKGAIATIP